MIYSYWKFSDTCVDFADVFCSHFCLQSAFDIPEVRPKSEIYLGLQSEKKKKKKKEAYDTH